MSDQSKTLTIDDFCWGEATGAILIGLWASTVRVEPGKSVQLRAAVQNVAPLLAELGPDFVLAVQHGEEVFEQAGGPRWSEPLVLQPAEFQEILSWSLSEESGLKAGLNRCWVTYRSGDGECRSAVVEIEAGAPANDV